MIGPKKKISVSQKRTRHGAWQTYQIKKLVAATQITSCTHCGSAKRSHRVCPHCGRYRGKQVITIKQKGQDKIIDA